MATTQEIVQQQVNINLSRQIEAQARALAGMPSSVPPLPGGNISEGSVGALKQLAKERDAAMQALGEAQNLVKEWQSAMEAWRDLAQTLRDEIKSCPNHEAHKFGKNTEAMNHQRRSKEDTSRVSHGLTARYSPAEKGLS